MNNSGNYTPPVVQCIEFDTNCVVCTSFEETTIETLTEVEFTL